MTVSEIQKAILQCKKENDFCILAHAYQSQAILEVADYVGDSYGLSVQASRAKQQNILMCGVRFMAETCKVLCPDKNVYLANPAAGCPMADGIRPDELKVLQAQYPGYATVAYVNTTCALKALCDVCVTSSCAVSVCRELDADKILFVPDPNLGSFVAKQIPEKTFVFGSGGCSHHFAITKEDVAQAKALHPDALLLVHPECRPEAAAQADYIGSTTGILSFAENSSAKEFIIGTEISIVEHLQFACPQKRFYPLSAALTCSDMRVTTLVDVYNCICGQGGERIELPPDILAGAARCIKKMIALGG